MYKDNEELQAKSMGLHKNISDILENQILAKREQLRQLEGFYSILNFPLTRLEDASSDEGSSLVFFGSAELEVEKLEAGIQIKMGKLGEMLKRETFLEELGSTAAWKSIQTNMESLQDIQKELIDVINVLHRYRQPANLISSRASSLWLLLPEAS